MAETPSKRQREEAQIQGAVEEEVHHEATKHHKSSSSSSSYNHILSSLLDEEEDEPNEDLSSFITTFQQELSPYSASNTCPTTAETDPENPTAPTTTKEDYSTYSSTSSSSSSSSSKEEEYREDDEKESVIRHLLEASDDELGIPNREQEVLSGTTLATTVEEYNGGEGLLVNGAGDGFGNGGEVDGFFLCDGLWEFDDANANYYTLVQSQLFM